MKVLRNWFQTLRNCRGALFPPLLQVHWKPYVKNWFSNRKDAGWDKNMFPGPTHQIWGWVDALFNLAVTKILYFMFSVSCRVCHVLLRSWLPQPGHLLQVVPPTKKEQKNQQVHNESSAQMGTCCIYEWVEDFRAELSNMDVSVESFGYPLLKFCITRGTLAEV